MPPLLPRQERTFSDLNWEEFELLVGEIYRRMGYSVELSAGTGADGGVDLVLTRDRERVLVQCKNWSTNKVSVPAIREFFGILVSEGASWGIFVTAGNYTRDARDFAEGKSMYLIDGEQLKQLVKEVQSGPGDDLLNVALWAPTFMALAKVTDPVCPFCRASMAVRNGSPRPFWGCSTYPRCRGKREVRQYLGAARVV